MADFVEEQIVRHEWTGNVDNISYVGLLVRCKDCEYRSEWFCDIDGKYHSPEWFCANGRHKESALESGNQFADMPTIQSAT